MRFVQVSLRSARLTRFICTQCVGELIIEHTSLPTYKIERHKCSQIGMKHWSVPSSKFTHGIGAAPSSTVACPNLCGLDDMLKPSGDLLNISCQVDTAQWGFPSSCHCINEEQNQKVSYQENTDTLSSSLFSKIAVDPRKISIGFLCPHPSP